MKGPAGPSSEFLATCGPSLLPAVNSLTKRPRRAGSCSSREHVSLSQLEFSPQITLDAVGLYVAAQFTNPQAPGQRIGGGFITVKPLVCAVAAPVCSQSAPGAPPNRWRN